MTRTTRILCLLLFAALGCRKGGDDSAPVARVDDEFFTLRDLRAQIDTARGATEAQTQEVIQRWFLNEMLYREALRRGVDKDESTARRIADAQRQIVINEFLERAVYADASLAPGPDAVAEYYGAHREEFSLPADVALVGYALFRDRDAANQFRNAVIGGTAWQAAAAAAGDALLMKVDSAYHTQASLMPPELWRVAEEFKKKEPSFPVGTSNGFFVLTVWRYATKGTVPELPLVSGEIAARLLVERRKARFDSLVTALRSQHTLEVLSTPALRGH